MYLATMTNQPVIANKDLQFIHDILAGQGYTFDRFENSGTLLGEYEVWRKRSTPFHEHVIYVSDISRIMFGT